MIDWQRVALLKAEIGAEDFDEVVPLFLEEVSEITLRLGTEPDLDNLEEDLHCLKGSAMNLGFVNFARLCSDGETLAANGQAAGVDISGILISFAESRRTFLSGLETGVAA